MISCGETSRASRCSAASTTKPRTVTMAPTLRERAMRSLQLDFRDMVHSSFALPWRAPVRALPPLAGSELPRRGFRMRSILGEALAQRDREFKGILAENSRAAVCPVRRAEYVWTGYQPGGGFLRIVMVRSWMAR